MTVLTLRIDLLGPVLVTSLDGDPNSMVSYDYLPGSVLRGALIGAYMRAHGLREIDPTDEVTRRLFFDGRTRYLNGYPVPYGDKRALPTPRSWFHEKGAEYPVSDLAAPPDERPEPVQARRVAAPFCYSAPAVKGEDEEEMNGVALLIRPERQVTVHIARPRKGGVAPTADGDRAVFRYDALAAGQGFMAALLADNPHDAGTVRGLLDAPCELTVGAARSAGYGRVLVRMVEEIDAGWREARDAAGSAQASGHHEDLTITLLSHALLRDPYGQYGAGADLIGAAVAARLGLAEPLRPREGRVFTAGEVVGGFNRTWGLPLPQTLAVRMGSVCVFPRPDIPDLAARLVLLEEQGIGERRVDGFGRVAVDWPAGAVWDQMKKVARPRTQPYPLDGVAGSDTARRMVDRLLAQRLDTLLVARANNLGDKITPAGPKPSQLARLRGILQDALIMTPTDGRKRLADYLDALSARQVTRRQFTVDRVDNRPLLEWLWARVEDRGADAGIWRDLGVAPDTLATIGGVAPALTDTLAYYYNLRLIDGVLARAAKRIA